MYGHMTVAQLVAQRDTLQAAYTRALTGPTVAAGTGRRVEYAQNAAAIRRELESVIAEIARRCGKTPARGPIYLV
jgi:hypothetical protein